jgi:hypothetical protein
MRSSGKNGAGKRGESPLTARPSHPQLIPLDRTGRTWYFVASTDEEVIGWMEVRFSNQPLELVESRPQPSSHSRAGHEQRHCALLPRSIRAQQVRSLCICQSGTEIAPNRA